MENKICQKRIESAVNYSTIYIIKYANIFSKTIGMGAKHGVWVIGYIDKVFDLHQCSCLLLHLMRVETMFFCFLLFFNSGRSESIRSNDTYNMECAPNIPHFQLCSIMWKGFFVCVRFFFLNSRSYLSILDCWTFHLSDSQKLRLTIFRRTKIGTAKKKLEILSKSKSLHLNWVSSHIDASIQILLLLCEKCVIKNCQPHSN